jgi:serine/threonine protein kinase
MFARTDRQGTSDTAACASFSKRVLHRDLKTQNIFLLGNGRLVLGDLGISKVGLYVTYNPRPRHPTPSAEVLM